MKKSFHLLHAAVISQGLCARCGLCVGVCPANALGFDEHSFPVLTGPCQTCGLCVACCPGAEVDLPALTQELHGRPYDYSNLQGPLESTFVGHAADHEIRHAGASGGVVTALLLFLLSTGQINGAVIVDADPEKPYLFRGKLACTVKEISSAAQSKYCLVPSMEALREVRASKGRFVVVARPCQVQGLRKLALADPTLFAKIEVILGLYCSCTLQPEAHLEFLQAAGICQEEVARFEFRGEGWPGGMVVEKKSGHRIPLHPGEAYGTVINTLFRLYAPDRCRLCLDGTSELADLSFGDFWSFDYADELRKLERCTLISQRTVRGGQILAAAEKAGVVVLHPLPANRFSQRALAMVKGKRSRAAIAMAKRRKQNLSVPDYHITIPQPGLAEWRKNLSSLMAGLFRGRLGRAFVLRVLLSPWISVIHRLRMKVSFWHGQN
ncbi:Coenzyme F420 hydrogenase/dehydrogenase, beta subunit C-terminal domain [Candidatus Electronema sp. PJ]|uniref:Coenzyme F420 hydrogenase/dehydrogenase, beta subunit C-terminal domain n=1 Tax=Candidatus Electronema sp. PJ TaxID=3401572 RepID=UPI003AA878A9